MAQLDEKHIRWPCQVALSRRQKSGTGRVRMLLPEKVTFGKDAVVAAMEATLRTPEGSDDAPPQAQTPTKGSRAGFFILRGGLKDRSEPCPRLGALGLLVAAHQRAGAGP